MFKDLEKEILFQSAKQKGAEGLYNGYLRIRAATGLPTDAESIEYLKAFVQYHYMECIRIVREKDNKHLTTLPYEDDYIHFLSLIAAYYIDNNEYVKGLLWTMKAIELCDILYPTMSDWQKHEFLQNKVVTDLYYEYYPKYPVQDLYNQFYLDWELKEGIHLNKTITQSNDNTAILKD